MKNEALKNLLAEDKKAMQSLHEIAHIDWQQPVIVAEYQGKFTENSILNTIGKLLDDPQRRNYNIYMIYKPDKKEIWWTTRSLYIAQIFGVSIRSKRGSIKCYTDFPFIYFDNVTMQKDFEEIRKNNKTRYWIIIQAKSMEKYREKIYYDKERYYTKEEYGNIYVKPMANNYPYIRAEKMCYREFNFDKSGYNRGIYHDELLQRLAEIRKQRSEAAARNYDNTEKLAEIKTRLQKINEKLIEMLNRERPLYNIVSKATSLIDYRYSDIEEFKENQFTSIERVNWKIELIEDTLTKIEGILD